MATDTDYFPVPSSGTSTATIIDATALTWEDCCLRAARRVIAVPFKALQPAFDFWEGSLALGRMAQLASGTGANTYSQTKTGRVSMTKTAGGAGTATNPTPANAVLPTGVQPILIAAEISFDTLATMTSGYDAQIALCDQATWEMTVGITQSRSTARL